jgi:hypothetical protein
MNPWGEISVEQWTRFKRWSQAKTGSDNGISPDTATDRPTCRPDMVTIRVLHHGGDAEYARPPADQVVALGELSGAGRGRILSWQ